MKLLVKKNTCFHGIHTGGIHILTFILVFSLHTGAIPVPPLVICCSRAISPPGKLSPNLTVTLTQAETLNLTGGSFPRGQLPGHRYLRLQKLLTHQNPGFDNFRKTDG